jgi:hypothetical protein
MTAAEAAVRPPVFDRMKKKKPVTRKVPICLDPELTDALIECEVEVEERMVEAARNGDDRTAQRALGDARVRRDEAQERVRAETLVYVFRGLGRPAFEKVLDEHPPTKEQTEAARNAGKDIPEYDPDPFHLALVVATLREVEENVDGVVVKRDPPTEAEMKDFMFGDPDPDGEARVNAAEIAALVAGALASCQSHRVVDLGKG